MLFKHKFASVFLTLVLVLSYFTGIVLASDAEPILKGYENTYTYGDEPFEVYVENSFSTGEVTYSLVDNESYYSWREETASIDGDLITILKRGSFKIKATIAADDNYEETEIISDLITVKGITPKVEIDVSDDAWALGKAGVTVKVTGIEGEPKAEGYVCIYINNDFFTSVELDENGVAVYNDYRYRYLGTYSFYVYYEAWNGGQRYYEDNQSKTINVYAKPNEQGVSVTGIPEKISYGDEAFTIIINGGYVSMNALNYNCTVLEGDDVISIKDIGLLSNPYSSPAQQGYQVTLLKPGKAKISLYKSGGSYHLPFSEELYIVVLPEYYFKGDTNGDGEITIEDAIEVFKHLAEKTTLEGEAFDAADINNNNQIDLADAINIFKCLAGKISLTDLQSI